MALVCIAEARFLLETVICGNGKASTMFATQNAVKKPRLDVLVVNPKRLAPSSSAAKSTPATQRVDAKMHLAVDAVPYKQQNVNLKPQNRGYFFCQKYLTILYLRDIEISLIFLLSK
jgi:hypothetical protein